MIRTNSTSIQIEISYAYSINVVIQITSFRVDRKTGLLTFTGQYRPVGTSMASRSCRDHNAMQHLIVSACRAR
jgi:hypothetical protein